MALRRNKITLREARVVALVAGASGVLAALAGGAPTGGPVVDAVLTFGLGALVAWASASASWWALVAAGGAALVLAPTLPLSAVAAAVTLLGIVIGFRKDNQPVLRAVAGLGIVQVMVRLGDQGSHGLTAWWAAAVLVPLVAIGVVRRPQVVRRRVFIAAGVVGGTALVATAGLGIAVLQARDDLETGERAARAGLAEARGGDPEAARTNLAEAGGALERSARALDRPWAQPARFLPVVAQHRTAALDLTVAAATATADVGDALAAVDLGRLRPEDGVVDLAQAQVLGGALTLAASAIETLSSSLDGADSPWLLAPLHDRIDRLADEVDRADRQVGRAAAVARVAPGLLGADGPRRYFVAFTTASEARGTGFLGNFAELSADGGRLSVDRFGENAELITGGAAPDGRLLTGPPDFLDRYDRFGARGDGFPATADFWTAVTMSPHAPSVGQVMAELYPQSGGQPVDGALIIDVDGLVALLAVTGPVEVPEVGKALDASNARQFLLVDQYRLTGRGEREDLLAAIAQATTEKLLGGSLPSPDELARRLGPAVAAGHIALWSADADEQEALGAVGATGGMPVLDGADGLMVVNNNQSGNKADIWLQRTIDYEVTVDEQTGALTADLTLALTNTTPTTGLPEGVIGNIVDLPTGTNRTYLSIYSPHELGSATLDGTELLVEYGNEAGWRVYSTFLELAPGSTSTVQLHLTGQVPDVLAYRMVLKPQAMVNPDEMTAVAATTSGVRLTGFRGPLTTVIDRSLARPATPPAG